MTTRVAETDGAARMALSARDVAATLGISERQVWRLTSTGELPAPSRVGSLARWDRQALLEWWRQRQPEPAR